MTTTKQKTKPSKKSWSALGRKSWEKRVKEKGKKRASADMKALAEKRWRGGT